MDSDSAIWVDGLTKVYRSGGNEVNVFQGLSLRVRSGERLAIIGESGAGKSTLLHLLGGLDRPSGGSIWYGERNLAGLNDLALAEFRNREIGFVWQNPSLLPEFTAIENVMMPLLIRGIPPAEAARVAAIRLGEVGLNRRAGHRAGELSGGEQQRVALARALAGNPKVLLADEPTGSLDLRTGESIVNLLVHLHASNRLTAILATHNLDFARRCDRILELRDGGLHAPVVGEWAAAGEVQDATRLGGGTYV